MDLLDIAKETRSLHMDENVIPDSEGFSYRHTLHLEYANHGRQIVRGPDGRYICAFISDKGGKFCFLSMAVAEKPGKAQGGDLCSPVFVAGTEAPPVLSETFFVTPGKLNNVCLVVDGENKLNVFYSNENTIYHSYVGLKENSLEQIKGKDNWTHSSFFEGALLGDAEMLPGGKIAVYGVGGGTLYEKVAGEEAVKIAERAIHPSVFIEEDGTRHIAYERDRRVYYSKSSDGKKWTDTKGNPGEELVAHFCSSWPSVAINGSGKLIIAYQGEGKVALKESSDFYAKKRIAGGSSVSYAVLTENGWKRHDLLRGSEIILKRAEAMVLPEESQEPPFKSYLEEFWRPSLSVDRYGVVWMFFNNTTRRHIFFSRFKGEVFEDYHEAGGAFDCPSRNYYIQKNSDSDSIGYMAQAANQVYFDSLPVPAIKAGSGNSVVFLDNMEIAEMSGLEHCLGQWEKYPQVLEIEGDCENPLDKSPGWCQAKKTEDGFEMHFMPRGFYFNNGMPGRAFSSDGINWKLGEFLDVWAMTLNGQPFPDTTWRPIYIEDVDEKDPEKRYKGLWGNYTCVKGVELRFWKTVVSPDTMNWKTVPEAEVNVLGDISVNSHIIRDDFDEDPRRRYKVFMLKVCHSGRAMVMYTSADLINWSRPVWLRNNPDSLVSGSSVYPTGPIILDPDAGESPWEEEIHDAVAWCENGMVMAHYDAFYFRHNQHINKALAVSRDGRHFWRVKRGNIDLFHGAAGDWDSGRMRTSVPIRVGNELWMYYCGMPAGCFTDVADNDIMKKSISDNPASTNELRPWQLGLAKLRVGGWAYMRLKRDTENGCLRTIPFNGETLNLTVNGTGLKGMSVEVLTADGKTVPGYEKGLFDADDSIDAKVKWQAGDKLPQGEIVLEFHFTSEKNRLYSFELK